MQIEAEDDEIRDELRVTGNVARRTPNWIGATLAPGTSVSHTEESDSIAKQIHGQALLPNAR